MCAVYTQCSCVCVVRGRQKQPAMIFGPFKNNYWPTNDHEHFLKNCYTDLIENPLLSEELSMNVGEGGCADEAQLT